MKHKGESGSKISMSKTNTNRKRAPKSNDGNGKISASTLKKNEFALIILGALLLTIIIFFVFFRSPEPRIKPVKENVAETSFTGLEKRLEKIEAMLKIKENNKKTSFDQTSEEMTGPNPVEERLTRLETAFSVKFDSLIERMEKIEKNILSLEKKMSKDGKSNSRSMAATKTKSSIPIKKPVKKEKKSTMFHTVKKGETLYFISKKYNISIPELRKLNNLSKNAKIYPGDNILVR